LFYIRVKGIYTPSARCYKHKISELSELGVCLMSCVSNMTIISAHA